MSVPELEEDEGGHRPPDEPLERRKQKVQQPCGRRRVVVGWEKGGRAAIGGKLEWDEAADPGRQRPMRSDDRVQSHTVFICLSSVRSVKHVRRKVRLHSLAQHGVDGLGNGGGGGGGDVGGALAAAHDHDVFVVGQRRPCELRGCEDLALELVHALAGTIPCCENVNCLCSHAGLRRGLRSCNVDDSCAFRHGERLEGSILLECLQGSMARRCQRRPLRSPRNQTPRPCPSPAPRTPPATPQHLPF